MPSYTPNTPELYRFCWAVRSLTINDRFVALYDSHATPRCSIASLHDVLGISEALTALEEVRADLFEVLIGQIRRSEKMSVFLNGAVSQQADILNGQRICTEIVTLAGRTVIPDKVRFTGYPKSGLCIQCFIIDSYSFWSG